MTHNPDEWNTTDRVGDEIHKNKRSAFLKRKIKVFMWVIAIGLFISVLIRLIYD